MSLLEHFKKMQEKAAEYISPAGYFKLHEHPDGSPPYVTERSRDKAFIEDMIYMLDGPEQRAAEESWAADLQGEAAEWRMDIRKQVEQAEEMLADARSDAKRARDLALAQQEQTSRLERENNDLRSRLMDSELAYAKLVGYLEALKDREPPMMVPVQREDMLSRMPDGTQGASSARSWVNGSGGSPARSWYHK